MQAWWPKGQRDGPLQTLVLLFLVGLASCSNPQPQTDLISTLNHAWSEKRAVVDARLSELPVGRKGKFGVYHEGVVFGAPYRSLFLSFDSLLGLDFYVFDLPQIPGLEDRLKDSFSRILGVRPQNSVLKNGVSVSKWETETSLCELRVGAKSAIISGRPKL